MLYKTLDLKLNPLRESNYSYTQLFIISALLFIGAIIVGIVFNQYLAEFAYRHFLEPTFSIIDKLNIFNSPFVFMLLIFLKNIIAVLITLYLARRTRGISIILLLCLNGAIIGSFLTLCCIYDMSLVMILVGILPHGIFEFTAVFWGAALGLKLLFVKEEELNKYKTEVNKLVCRWIVPILFVAAFIEVYITPICMSLVN